MSRCYHGLLVFLLVCFLAPCPGTGQMTEDVPAPNVTIMIAFLDTFFASASLVTHYINCTIVSFTPPNVTWTVDDPTVTLEQPELVAESEEGIYSSRLLIDRVILGSTNKVFTCSAVNVNGSANDSVEIQVFNFAPSPKVTTITGVSDTVSVTFGDELVLSCTVDSAFNVTFAWTGGPNNQLLTSTTTSYDGAFMYSSNVTVSVTHTSDEDYTCFTTSSVGSSLRSITVTVNVPPPVIQPIPDQSVTIGHNVTFVCNASTPLDLTYEWRFEPKLFNLCPGHSNCFLGENERELTIVSVVDDFNTNVTCNATDTRGQSTIETAELIVNVPDPNVTVSPSELTVPHNTRVILTCEATSLVPVNITWSTTANNIVLPDPEFSSTGGGAYTSTLELPQVTTNHTGIYYCSVDNQRSIVNDTASLEVFVPALEVTIMIPFLDTLFAAASLDTRYINCTIISFTPPNVTWTVDDPTVTLEQPELVAESEEGIYSSRLLIDRVILGSTNKVFTCAAVNVNGSANDTVEIIVFNFPPFPTIRAANAVNGIVPVAFGDEVVLSCTIDSAINVTFIWIGGPGLPLLSSTTVYDGAFFYSSNVTISVTYTIDRSYTCFATSSLGTQTRSIRVTVIVPPPVIQPIPDQSVTIGQDVTFVCNASTPLDLTYNWTFEPELSDLCHYHSNCFFTAKEFTIFNVVDDFNTNVTCNATDTRGQSIVETAELIVNGIESELLSNITLDAIVNSTVLLNCTFSYPSDLNIPVVVTWHNESMLLDPDTNDNVEVTSTTMTVGDRIFIDSQLKIIKFQPFYDTSPITPFIVSYNCIATPEGRPNDQVKSPTIRTNVLHTPIFDTTHEGHPENPTRINRGNTTTVSCKAVGNPSTIMVFEEVFSNGTVRNLTVPQVDNGQVPYLINISDVSEHLYRCAASNKFGTRIYDFRVIIQDIPDPVDSATIDITLLSFLSARVEWTPPFDNLNNITSYWVTYTPRTNGIAPINHQIGTNTVIIDNLVPNEIYDLTVSAVNGVGPGMDSLAVPFNSISSSNASLTDVLIPRVLITTNSFLVQWKYPTLLTDPLINTPAVDVQHISFDFTSSAGRIDPVTVGYNPSTTSVTIDDGITPDSRITVRVNIIYTNPSFQGNEVAVEIQTLAPDYVPDDPPEVNRSNLTGPNPVLRLSWTPLTPDNGLEFLQHYVVFIIATQLPQVHSKREAPSTMNIVVNKSESSFEFNAKPFTRYTSQVLSQLNVNGVIGLVAITAPIVQQTNEIAPETAPSNITYTDLSFTSVTLSWELPTTPNGFIFSYTVKRTSPDSSTEVVAMETSTTHSTSSLIGGNTYNFSVSGSNSEGESPSASIEINTPAGVYPLATPAISAGPENTIIVTIPGFSTRYGPLSHYLIVVITNGNVPADGSPIYDNTDNRWRDLGYYATAAIPANNDNCSFTVGDGNYSTFNSMSYYNAPLNKGMEYSIFIRLYSGADNPFEQYRDSSPSNKITIPSDPASDPHVIDIVPIVIPIVVVLLLLGLIIVVIIIVFILFRRPSKHTEAFTMEEIHETQHGYGFLSTQEQNQEKATMMED